MTNTTPAMPLVVPVDEEHGRMMEYALSPEGKAAIEKAQSEIDAGLGIVADDAYFEMLRARRAKWRSSKSLDHA